MTGPALSNYLAVLAVEVAGEVAAFKRSSRAAHVAVLTAGRKLVDARESARRGEWAPFLEAAGIEARTARNWMTLARAGLTPDDVTAAGGVQGALDRLRAEKAESNSGIATPDPGPEIGHGGRFAGPEPVESRASLHETALGEGEPRSVQADAPGRCPETVDWVDREAARDPDRGMTLYQWRRARGLCTVCEAPTHKARCDGCAAKLAERRARDADRAKLGAALAVRIEAAAKAGRGIRLTAADVARLAGERR